MSITTMIVIYVIEFAIKAFVLVMARVMNTTSYISRGEKIQMAVFLFVPVTIVIIKCGAFLIKPWTG